MRMKAQILSPGMQYTDCSAFDPVVAVSKALQRLSHALEHGIVKPCAIGHTERIQLMGYREHCMKILYRQGILHAVLHPKHLFCGLAFGAMPVAATVVAGAFAPAAIATFYVSAQDRSAALLQGIGCTDNKAVGL